MDIEKKKQESVRFHFIFLFNYCGYFPVYTAIVIFVSCTVLYLVIFYAVRFSLIQIFFLINHFSFLFFSILLRTYFGIFIIFKMAVNSRLNLF